MGVKSGVAAARRQGIPTQMVGPRGGRYYINANGNKVYGTPPAERKAALRTRSEEEALPRPPIGAVRAHEEYTKRVADSASFAERKSVSLFTKGYDTTIRALQGGQPESALVEARRREYGDKDKRGESPEEHVRKAKLAAADTEKFIARAAKATHIDTVYRGIHVDDATLGKLLDGSSFGMMGRTTSASWNPGIAMAFGTNVPAGRHGVLLKMKHKSGVGIETMSSAGKHEREILLPGSAKFKITDKYKLEDGTVVIEGVEG